MKKIIVILATYFLLMSNVAYSLPTLKITIRVIDENGVVIKNAKVGASLEHPKPAGTGVETTEVRGFTDSNGLFTIKGSGGAYIGFNVKKEGYYVTYDLFRDFTGVSGMYGFRKWQPWNPSIDVVLKKKINPIPMYVASIEGIGLSDDPAAILPEEGKFFGFDLIAKDWVAPHGHGLYSDFIFKIDVAHYVNSSNYDSTMILKFTNPDDGLLPFFAPKNRGSDLRSSHNAPLIKYKNKLVIRLKRKIDKISDVPFRDDQNYYFRVRTKRDEQGNIIEAHYGKIYGNIKFYIPNKDNKGKIYFSYYLNPNNNDTNVEFSPEKNLFPKPKDYRGSYRFKP